MVMYNLAGKLQESCQTMQDDSSFWIRAAIFFNLKILFKRLFSITKIQFNVNLYENRLETIVYMFCLDFYYLIVSIYAQIYCV